MMRLLLASILILCYISTTKASTANGVQVKERVWVMYVFGIASTRNTIRAMFQQLGEATGQHLGDIDSGPVDTLYQVCKKHPPAYAAAGLPIAEQLIDQCNYELLVIAKHPIHVYLVDTKPSPSDKMRIGLITGSDAARVAREELGQRYPKLEFVEYRDYLSLFDRTHKDQLQGIIATGNMLRRFPVVEKKFPSVISLRNRATASVVVHQSLPQAVKEKARNYFLDNGPVIQEIWNESLGLGRFQRP